jgi:hypothetical protein
MNLSGAIKYMDDLVDCRRPFWIAFSAGSFVFALVIYLASYRGIADRAFYAAFSAAYFQPQREYRLYTGTEAGCA